MRTSVSAPMKEASRRSDLCVNSPSSFISCMLVRIDASSASMGSGSPPSSSSFRYVFKYTSWYAT